MCNKNSLCGLKQWWDYSGFYADEANLARFMVGVLFRELDRTAGLDDAVERQLPSADMFKRPSFMVQKDEHLMSVFTLLDILRVDDILGILEHTEALQDALELRSTAVDLPDLETVSLYRVQEDIGELRDDLLQVDIFGYILHDRLLRFDHCPSIERTVIKRVKALRLV